MLRFLRYASLALIIVGALALALLYFGSVSIPVLQPKGLIAAEQKQLLIVSTLLMLIVVVPVFFLTGYISWKYRKGKSDRRYLPDWDHSPWLEALWWGLPLAIIAALSVLTWKSSHSLDPFRPIASAQKPLKIQVVALQWKWLFLYPEEGIASVNYLRFPVSRPLEFDITSDAPMNAFWIPQLGGQIYAMPGMQSKLHLIADVPGIYRGSSANLSGRGFAGMVFSAQATDDEDYANWIETVREGGEPLGWSEYRALAQPSERNPVSYYFLEDRLLFHKVIEQYTKPDANEEPISVKRTPR
jgi:cytochrome o ubiquinol oxidase subunit 2